MIGKRCGDVDIPLGLGTSSSAMAVERKHGQICKYFISQRIAVSH